MRQPAARGIGGSLEQPGADPCMTRLDASAIDGAAQTLRDIRVPVLLKPFTLVDLGAAIAGPAADRSRYSGSTLKERDSLASDG